jgi:hypothetical protein
VFGEMGVGGVEIALRIEKDDVHGGGGVGAQVAAIAL